MCYTSRQVRDKITRIVREHIGPALQSEIAALRKEGKEYLFAGVLLGAEAGIDDYTTFDADTRKLIEKNGDPLVRLGYCALTGKGYSQEHPPEDVTKALAQVNQEYIAFWASQFVQAGIPGSKLYTHIAASVDQSTSNAPIWIAFNEYSRPGWTTYPGGALAEFTPLYEELQEHGNPMWAGVEANANFGPYSVGWESYLAWHYNHGAALVGINVGATSETLMAALEKSAFGPQAVAAYKKFLAGEQLREDQSKAKDLAKSIQEKVLKVRTGIEQWQAQHRDPSAIGRMMEDFEPLIRQGKYEEAEELLDQALKALGK